MRIEQTMYIEDNYVKSYHEKTGKCFERPAKILRGMQSSVPKINTGKCLLTVGTDVKNVTEGRGGERRGGEGKEGGDPARFFMWIQSQEKYSYLNWTFIYTYINVQLYMF